MTRLASKLRDWELELVRLGAPVDRFLLPGLAAGDVAERLDPVFGSTHTDLPTWFGWHDGSSSELAWAAAPTGAELMSLSDCLRLRTENLALFADDDDDPFLPRWDPAWLPLLGPGNLQIGVDTCSGEVPVFFWDDEDFPARVAPSLEVAVTAWADALRANFYRWSGDRWVYDFASFPMLLRASGLIF